MRGNDGVVVIPGVIGDPCGPGFPVVAGNDGEGGNDSGVANEGVTAGGVDIGWQRTRSVLTFVHA